MPIHLHNFFHIHVAKAIERNIFEIEINVDWTIAALNNINLIDVQWIDANQIYVPTTVFVRLDILIYRCD